MSDSLPTALPAWLHYQHPDVRNLAWVLAAPALLRYLPDSVHPVRVLDDRFWQPLAQAYQPRLAALNADPRPLTDFLSQQRNHRLGYYFEHLLLFWLQDEDWHPFRVLAHHAALYQGKLTIGELDFLLLNTRGQVIEHWEVAVKFYLGHAPYSQAARWLGPNCHDTLGNKLQHLAQQQFRFQAYAQWPIAQRCLVMKGQLFYPQGQTLSGPDCLNPAHLRGAWWDWQAFVAHPAHALLNWRHADRQEWLSHQQDSLQLPLQALNTLTIAPSQRPELLLGFAADGQEQQRCFVYPPDLDSAC